MRDTKRNAGVNTNVRRRQKKAAKEAARTSEWQLFRLHLRRSELGRALQHRNRPHSACGVVSQQTTRVKRPEIVFVIITILTEMTPTSIEYLARN
jgi:hypothetical protein